MELIYATDPLCMWSYAFTHVLNEFVVRHKNEFLTSVVCSGMIRGDLAINAAAERNKITDASEIISEKSGIKFGPAFYDNLNREDLFLDSVPGSIAINLVKNVKKPQALNFAFELSRNIFAHGLDSGSHEQIAKLLNSYELKFEDSMSYLKSDTGRYAAYQDFQWFEAASLRRTPVLLLHVQGEIIQLTQGYTSYETLEKVYAKVIEQFQFRLN